MPHHFTVVVEEYFHPTPIGPWSPRSRWSDMDRRSPLIVGRILDLLATHDVRATFFILGWLAEREPDMVTAIAGAGHEVASHGWDHRLVSEFKPHEFREDVRRTKSLLEDLIGAPVRGYRAPSFSIVPGSEWALNVLVEEGHTYDSSLFPTRLHPTYGYPCERDPHGLRLDSGRLVEIPPTTLRISGTNLPASGGAYFRLFPYALIQKALASSEKRHATGTFYIHPWELDPDPPKLPLPWLVRLRVRGRYGDLWARLGRLLKEFEFRRMDLTAEEILATEALEWTDRAAPLNDRSDR
jgi:polysaccharide deacetylase family protein (PEP-CTERM system associated)